MTARARSPKVIEGSVTEAEVEGETPEKATMHKLGQIDILMFNPNATQIAMLGRLVKASERDPQGTFLRLADVFFRIVENLIVNQDDVYRLEEEIVARRVEMADICKGLMADAEQAPNRRTRRVR